MQINALCSELESRYERCAPNFGTAATTELRWQRKSHALSYFKGERGYDFQTLSAYQACSLQGCVPLPRGIIAVGPTDGRATSLLLVRTFLFLYTPPARPLSHPSWFRSTCRTRGWSGFTTASPRAVPRGISTVFYLLIPERPVSLCVATSSTSPWRLNKI